MRSEFNYIAVHDVYGDRKVITAPSLRALSRALGISNETTRKLALNRGKSLYKIQITRQPKDRPGHLAPSIEA